MKFIWNEPPKQSADGSLHYPYPKIHWEQAVFGWLRFNGVWVEPNTFERKYHSIGYNYCWHFYDLSIFEDGRPGHGEPRHVIDEMMRYLESTTLDWTVTEGAQLMSSGERPDGARFWIQAEDFPRKIRRRWKGCLQRGTTCPKQPGNAPPIPSTARLCTGCNKPKKDKKPSRTKESQA